MIVDQLKFSPLTNNFLCSPGTEGSANLPNTSSVCCQSRLMESGWKCDGVPTRFARCTNDLKMAWKLRRKRFIYTSA